MTAPIRCWHFASDTLRDGRPLPAKGDILTHSGPVVPCKSGYHGSVLALDALRYAPGLNVARVDLSGEVVPHNDDKHAASVRRNLSAYVNAREVILAWAFGEADRAVRVHAVAALRSAGLYANADTLAALAPIVDKATADAAVRAADAAVRAADAAVRAADAAWSAAYAAWSASCAASSAAGAAVRAAYAASSAAYAAESAAYAAWSSALAESNARLESALTKLLRDCGRLEVSE